ncbi:hypothetical protein RvY_04673-2 [Ramazzottius varieornatus]|uniref:Uncharacterized protein n=1 Tax=Ramazzottius varieornatus TaxID=947166 RepID=A0A1D1V2C4_RAMVA|nr:hypothetical protein RvY_04673-2 [Ramazzottius varieornatus]
MASSGSSDCEQREEGRGRFASWLSNEEWLGLQSNIRATLNEPVSSSRIQSQLDEVLLDNMEHGNAGEEKMGQWGMNAIQKSPEASVSTVRPPEDLQGLYKSREQRRERLEHSGVLDLLTKILVRTHVSEGAPQTLEAFRGTIAYSTKFNPVEYEVKALEEEKAALEEKIVKRKEAIAKLKEKIQAKQKGGLKGRTGD